MKKSIIPLILAFTAVAAHAQNSFVDGPVTLTGNTNTVWNAASYYSIDSSGRTFAFGSRSGNFSISDETAGAIRFLVSNAGNVGIGSLLPRFRFSVNTSPGSNIHFRNASDWGGGRITGVAIDARNDAENASVPLLMRASSFEFYEGNVGIGTTAPEQKLQVTGGRLMVNTAAPWDNFQIYTDGTHSYLEANGDEDGLWIRSNVGQKVIIPDANVGIGTTNPTEKLSVNGRIRAKEVIVDTGWSDYVFAKDYKLASLSDVEQHIEQQGHLPGVPSAQEVADKGVSVGDMQAILLAKIEELTLHQIAQEKAIGSLLAKVQSLETENARLKVPAPTQ